MARLEQKPRRTVRRAEDFYAPPPQMRAEAWDHLAPAERVIAYLEHVQQRRYPRPDGILPEEPLIARVDAGRWVAQCPDCASAQVVSPADPRMWCVDCQPDGWYRVRFPGDPDAVETEMAARSARDRFWWSDDDTAWNRPPQPPPLTPKQIAAVGSRFSIPPPAPDPASHGEEPTTDGGVTRASRSASDLGGR